ncbi:MAG: leucyl aminopeptidase family protein [Jatrophihabitantaceae bacterium]
MPAVRLSERAVGRERVDAVAIAVFGAGGRLSAGAGVAECARAFGVDLLGAAGRDPGFRGEVGDLAAVLSGSDRQPVLLAVGLGAPDAVDADRLRLAAMALARAARGYRRLATTLAQEGIDRGRSVRAVVEGLLLGSYRYPRPGSVDARERAPEAITLLLGREDKARSPMLREGLRLGLAAGNASSWVRELVERPAAELTPAELAEEIRSRAAAHGASARVWSARTMTARGFGATLAVGAGSPNRPAVVELVHRGAGGPPIALAGKGITFDSGGINLKRDPAEIGWMKSDMAGAAAVAGAVCAAAALGGRRPVRAILPLAENMPGTGAMRPGDVVRHPDGRTTEVVDTDSEGRLVLADAIAYLAAARPAALIDVGTLTDGGGVGHLLWGAWTNAPDLLRELLDAGEVAGEPGWHLPLRPQYRTLLASPVADLSNCARDVADTGQMAATYLSTFADGVPWVHIDNGSTAYLDGDLAPWTRGATGSPVRALLELLLREAEPL